MLSNSAGGVVAVLVAQHADALAGGDAAGAAALRWAATAALVVSRCAHVCVLKVYSLWFCVLEQFTASGGQPPFPQRHKSSKGEA